MGTTKKTPGKITYNHALELHRVNIVDADNYQRRLVNSNCYMASRELMIM